MTTDRSRPTKALATRIAPELASHLEPVLMHDSSTNTLIRHYRTTQGRARLKDTVMNLGYNRPLYLLPFDHRHSYVTGMFNFNPPLTVEQHEAVADSKRVIYDGFRQALGKEVPIASAAILVDEEFGADILRDAVKSGYVTALSTEKSGSSEFEFEFGAAFAEHIEAFGPTFAKALVRYNPEGDAPLNRRQTARLKQLSDYCRSSDQLFMFELLVPATKAQMDRVQADRQTFDLRVRPALTSRPSAHYRTPESSPMCGRSKGSIAARTASALLKRCAVTAGTRSAASFWDAVPMRKRWRAGSKPPLPCRDSPDSRSGARLSGTQWPITTRKRRADKRPRPEWPSATASGWPFSSALTLHIRVRCDDGR